MTAYDRVMSTLRLEAPDCVPALPVLLQQGAAECGLGLETYFSQGRNLIEGQLRLWERYGHDGVYGFPHVVEDITAFGAPLMYFEDGPPSAGDMVIYELDEVLNLDVPDPYEAPLLVETLRVIEGLAAEVGGEVPVFGACIAPFSLPSMLMGTELWMDLLLFQPDDVREEVMGHMLTVTTEFVVSWANAQLAAGADAIILADGMASASVLNRQQFIDFALPVVMETISRIEGPVIHEGVGDLHPLLDLLPGTGAVAAVLTYRDDLTDSKALAGEQMALIGNLNNIEMLRWREAEAVEHAEAALAEAAPGGGFILSAQGPEIPLGVPEYVIHAIVNSAHNWRY